MEPSLSDRTCAGVTASQAVAFAIEIGLATGSAPATVEGATAADKFLNADFSQKWAIIYSLATVALPLRRLGSRTFDPETTNVNWKE